jgi:hypothetical protein
MHPMPDKDASQIYEITPATDAMNGIWTVTAKPLVGLSIPATLNNTLFKRLEWHENLGVATFFLSARGPVYAYRPGTPAQTSSSTAPGPTTQPAPTSTSTTSSSTTSSSTTAIPGNLNLGVTAVPYTGPAGVLGISKHLDFARLPDPTGQFRWYKLAGDHAGIDPATSPPMNYQDGRQEIISFRVGANDWRLDQHYYVADPNQVQFAFPDDAFAMVRGDEAYVINTVTTNATPPYQPQGAATQVYGRVMAWKPGRGWRDVCPIPLGLGGDAAWRGLYDAERDRFVIPVQIGGLAWILIGGDGSDQTVRAPNGYPVTYGDHEFSNTGIVQDGRKAYLYDPVTSEIWDVDLDTFSLTRLVKLPEPPANRASFFKIAWDPDLRAVVVGALKLYAYEVDTNRLTTWDRSDGFVNGNGTRVYPSTMFFDPETRDIVTIGGIDWDTGMKSPNYWRLHLSR